MLKQEEIQKYLLSKEYVLEHGMPDDQLVDEYYIDDNDVYQYGQWLDKPLDEGGKPYNGAAYFLTEDGEYCGYQEYQNGYENGVGVTFYPDSGRMRRFSYRSTEEYCYCEWYKDGTLQKTDEERFDHAPRYEKKTEYDESGRLVREEIYFNITLFVKYDFDNPNPALEVSLHENGDIRQVRKLSPQNNELYSEVEFDPDGRLVRVALNSHYDSDSSSPEHEIAYWHIKNFDVNFREQGGIILYHNPDAGWLSYSGKLCFRHSAGWIEKIMEFERGHQAGGQKLYYANGKLREEYWVSKKGGEFNRHLWWYPDGVLKKAVIYSPNRKHKRTFEFDKFGNEISEREDSQ